ncbi:MAG: hypothetical protein Q9Q40_01685 [Acidobacteriota bacterium]|nr:hypothetical protein [Acidobacteriota bacterium]MDQ7086383.1 hypothetical protein [Acidobacteriota bacterium]
MKSWLLVLGLVVAVCAPQAAPGSRKKTAPTMGIRVEQRPAAATVGEPATVQVHVTPPDGIRLNRYPGITLEIDKADALDLSTRKAFVGSTKPINDVSKFGFETIDPLVLEFVPKAPGEHVLEGTLKYFYCVKKSGYCAPGQQRVRLPVKAR